MPRPNAGGGRHNKAKAAVSARARFSKAPKNLLDRIKKNERVSGAVSGGGRGGGGGGKGGGKGGVSERGSGAVRDAPLDKRNVESKALERLTLPQHSLNALLTLFEGPRPQDKAPTVRAPKPTPSLSHSLAEPLTTTTATATTGGKISSNTSKVLATLPFSLATATATVSASGPHSSASKGSKSTARDHTKPQISQATFTKYGFLPNEIKQISKNNNKCTQDNDFFLALLIAAREHSFPTAADVTNNPSVSAVSSNSDLTAEMEVLTSIYDSNVFHENFIAFGFLPCCRVSVLMDFNDVNLEIRMFISNADQYPNSNSKLYGWLIDPVAIAVGKSSGVMHTTAMSSESLRQVSLEAMDKIQYHHIQTEAPVAFDFIQHLNEIVPEHMAETKSVTKSTASNRSVLASGSKQGGGQGSQHSKKDNSISKAIGKDKGHPQPSNKKKTKDSEGGKQKGGVKGKGKPQEVECEVLSKGPKLPPMPVTFHIKGPEYRAAYGAALGKGLERTAAQALALEELEFILPISVLQELRKEIAYDEAKMEMSFSISKNVSTKEIIDGSKTLSEKLNVNKAAGKGLFLEAKDDLLASGDEYARSEQALKKKIISHALDMHAKKLEKKEEKKKEKDKQKQLELVQSETTSGVGKSRTSNRGLTIRDAYEIVEATKSMKVNDEEDFNDDDGQMEKFSDDIDIESSNIIEDGSCEAYVSDVRTTARRNGDSVVLKSAYGKISQAEAVARKGQHQAPEKYSVAEKKKSASQPSNVDLEKDSQRLRNLLNNKKCMTNYKDWLKKRSRLPAFQMKSEILQAIDNNSVVVISGDTGCGKTTQVPQLVLDDYIERGCGALCNIIVTQPRRISAVSVAEQIARERVEKVGLSVGYHIRLEAVKSASTRLLLMTTGVLLRKLQADDCNLEGVSHIFVDEVHERDINTDFLLIVLKKMLSINPHIKIILMSATLNADLFIDYFRNTDESSNDSISCALISIPGRAFPVNDFYLEDVLEQTGFEIDAGSDYAIKSSSKSSSKQGASKGQAQNANEKEYRKTLAEKHQREQHIANLRKQKKYSDKTLNSLLIADESIVNLDLIQKLVVHILTLDNTVVSGDNVGAILIFVPGLADIRSVIDILNERPEVSNSNSKVKVFPLHSSLSSQEQSRVFQILPHGARKIIVSTNIAETSVTIEDVVFVIDTCRVKENSYDDESQMNVLQEEFISQANARQRRGRAGRVRSGVCFHLVSKYSLEHMKPFTVPEMLRMSLEDLILQVLALDLGDPYTFLGEALSPPDRCSITSALLFLESLSAVNLVGEQLAGNTDAAKIKRNLPSEITPLGFHLAALPISPRLGKLMLYGVLLKCIDPILTIISTVSAKSPFVSSFEQRDVADKAKQNFLWGNSDLMSAMYAFDTWKSMFGNSGGKGGGRYNKDEDIFCKTNFLSSNSMKLIDQMRAQFLDLLKGIGFVSRDVNIRNVKDCDENSNGSNVKMIKCALCAGLSPNILMVPASAREKSGKLNKKLMELSLASSRKGYSLNVHPSSIMSDSKELDSNFVAYLEAMKTSKVYARDVTTISPVALALFCGKMSSNLAQGVVIVNGWLTFSAVADVSRCLTYVREEMEEAFIEKVLNPDAPQSPTWTKVLEILKGL